MSLARLTLFVAILAASLALANAMIRRRTATVTTGAAGPAEPLARAAAEAPPASETGAPKAPAPAASLVAVASAPKPGSSPGETVPPREEPPPSVEEDPLSAAVCPPDMLLVDGTTCGESTHRCEARLGATGSACARYVPASCRRGLALRFCVDRHEYPNQAGMLPSVMVTFPQAEQACAEEGKRLCTETEWAFACAGVRGFAFPYGDELAPGACNDGRPAQPVRVDALWSAATVAPTLERVDGRVRSGANARCASQFGVRDLTGNVEEWTRSDVPGFERALRGGDYSSPSPTCQGSRLMRQPAYRTPTTGFRCCRDPSTKAAAAPELPASP